MQLQAQASEVILGVDTHKQAHMVAALDGLGRRLGILGIAEFPADDSGGRRLLAWARRHGQIRAAGVEGTGSDGDRLARRLADAGITVVEVNRPDRSRRRPAAQGNSDPGRRRGGRPRRARRGRHRDPHRSAGAGRRPPRAGRGPPQRGQGAHPKRPTSSMRCCSAATTPSAVGWSGGATATWRTPAANLWPPVASSGIELALGSLGRRWQALSNQVAGLDADITKRVKKTAPKAPKLLDRLRRRRPHRCPVARHRR